MYVSCGRQHFSKNTENNNNTKTAVCVEIKGSIEESLGGNSICKKNKVGNVYPGIKYIFFILNL